MRYLIGAMVVALVGAMLVGVSGGGATAPLDLPPLRFSFDSQWVSGGNWGHNVATGLTPRFDRDVDTVDPDGLQCGADVPRFEPTDRPILLPTVPFDYDDGLLPGVTSMFVLASGVDLDNTTELLFIKNGNNSNLVVYNRWG